MFLTQLTPFLRDPYVIRAQIACHVQPRTTDPNCVKLTQKPEFVRDQYVIRPLGLCDRALRVRATRGEIINNVIANDTYFDELKELQEFGLCLVHVLFIYLLSFI